MQPKRWLVDPRPGPHDGARERHELADREARADEVTRAAPAFSQAKYQPGGEAPVLYDPFTTGEAPAEPARGRIGVQFHADAGATAPLDRYAPASGAPSEAPRAPGGSLARMYHPVSDLSAESRV